MSKAKEFKSKSDTALLRYYERLGKDIEYFDYQAERCGYGAGGEHFRNASREALEEQNRVKAELEHRKVIQ